jgi:signal transduction histidine kinase
MEMGRVYFGLNKPEESKAWLGKALKMASQIHDKDVLSKGYHLLSQVDSAAGDYGAALKSYQKHVAYRDSLANDETARHMIEQRLQYAFSKKEDSLRLEQALIAEKLDKQTLLSKQQQQELRLQQAALALAQREKDVQMLRFLKTQAELQLSNEQQEKKLALAAQEKTLQQSQLEKQTLLARQKEQALLLKENELSAQRSQRDFWIAGAAALLLFSFFIYRNYHQKQKANRLLQRQNIELEDQRDQTRKAMAELQQTQLQLIQKEKMASLGELTSGIAHEIRNPLNFVNNFSELNEEVLHELKTQVSTLSLTPDQRSALQGVTDELLHNQEKISRHGKRADAILKNMLQHARTDKGEKEPTDINGLVDEYLRLSYQGFRTKEGTPTLTLETHFDKSAGWVKVIPQDLSRVLVNLFNNAFYAVAEQKKNAGAGFEPTVFVSTKREGDSVLITVKDNGTGMPEKITAKVFQPFFTTKPAGEGTGLGLSMSYDLVTKGHSGEMKVASREGEGAEFTIQLPA